LLKDWQAPTRNIQRSPHLPAMTKLLPSLKPPPCLADVEAGRPVQSTLGCHRDGRALAVNHMLPSNQIESESRYGFKGRSWVTTTFRGMCCGKILYLFFSRTCFTACDN